MQLPPAFEEQLKPLLGTEWPAFLQSLEAEPPVSIRLNPQKSSSEEIAQEMVKWCKEGRYLAQRPVFTLDPLFQAGAYYVQEASSMFVAEVIRQCVPADQKIRALDLCAAPGGKTTLLASAIAPNSLLLANEVIRSRYSVLKENLQKWGYPNSHLANHDSQDFAQLNGFFDLVLTDAPCSGEGLFRKDKKAIVEWSPENVRLCSARQKRILGNAKNLLRPGGFLIYSTCTYNDWENQQNVEWLLKDPDFELFSLQINPDWGICKKDWGYQFYPHKIRGEGFFISVLQKKGTPENLADFAKHQLPERKKGKAGHKSSTFKNLTPLSKKQVNLLEPWIEQIEQFSFFQKPGGSILAILADQLQETIHLSGVLNRLELGTEIGMFKKLDFVPSHALALSTFISKQLPAVEVTAQEALLYLKKENFPLNTQQKGWALVTYQGLNLGWIKILPNRVNNYLPKEWRIRMALP